MARGASQRERLRVVQSWLEDSFPGQFPVKVRFVYTLPWGHSKHWGLYVPPDDARDATIYALWRTDQSRRIETLVHEWAHYLDDPTGDKAQRWHGGHTGSFYAVLARINRAWTLDGMDTRLRLAKLARFS